MSSSSLDTFCVWLKGTSFSLLLQTVSWIVPAAQCVHILAIAALIASALMITLRTLGLTARDRPWEFVARRFLPGIAWSLPVLLGTGLLLITAEPARSLENPAFWLKMVLLVAAIALSVLSYRASTAEPATWLASGARNPAGKAVAVLFLSVWVAIVFAGRWIAYIEAS